MNLETSFYTKIVDKGYYSSVENLRFYLQSQLFGDIDFRGKSFLDIGGGNGLFSFCAVNRGAKNAVVIEPEFDGSSSGVQDEFRKLSDYLDLSNVKMSTSLLQDYDAEGQKFDIVLMRNSINHIDEQACIRLHQDNMARQSYVQTLAALKMLTNPGAILIVTDCARRNLFGDLGITNPFAKSIEWHKHQQPKTWVSILKEVGFKLDFIKWLSFNSLRSVGSILQANKVGAYLTHSAFVLQMRKTT